MENYVENTYKDDLMDIWLDHFVHRMKEETNFNEMKTFTFKDAVEAKEFHTDRDKYLIQVCEYLENNRRFDKEFAMYLSHYNKTGNCQIPLNK